MLQGHIDSISEGKISGWIYSEAQCVTGRRVLAFSGSQCVGAGDVGLYRKDLHQAGLDDGRLGFEIQFNGSDTISNRLLHIRLENSDFCLFPSRFWNDLNPTKPARLGLYSQDEIDRIEWMAAQGWLTQDQYAMSKSINLMGIYQRAFSRAELVNTDLESLVARSMSECYGILLKIDPGTLNEKIMVETYIPETSLATISHKKSSHVIGLFSSAFRCRVGEGRQRSDVESPDQFRTIQYQNSAYQMMILHLDCLDGELEYSDIPPQVAYLPRYAM